MSCCTWLFAVVAILVGILFVTTPDLLHPQRIVTVAFGRSQFIGSIKKVVVEWLYDYMASSFPQDFWTCMNYGYAELDDVAIDENSDRPKEHFNFKMYHHTASLSPHGESFEDLDVLEISCGRGGGAKYLTSVFKPKKYLATDLSNSAVALCNKLHKDVIEDGVLSFDQGDAENLTKIADSSFDVIINVEAVHAFGNIDKFVGEVERVLKPQGYLLLAGFVATENLEWLKERLQNGGLTIKKTTDIRPNVLKALEIDEPRRAWLIDQIKNPLFKLFATGFAAMKGTSMRAGFEKGDTEYVSFALQNGPKTQ